MHLFDILAIVITGWFLGIITLAGGFAFLVKFAEKHDSHPTADGRYISLDEMVDEAKQVYTI